MAMPDHAQFIIVGMCGTAAWLAGQKITTEKITSTLMGTSVEKVAGGYLEDPVLPHKQLDGVPFSLSGRGHRGVGWLVRWAPPEGARGNSGLLGGWRPRVRKMLDHRMTRSMILLLCQTVFRKTTAEI